MPPDSAPPISLWREAALLLRFVAEAGAVSGGIVLVAWMLV